MKNENQIWSSGKVGKRVMKGPTKVPEGSEDDY